MPDWTKTMQQSYEFYTVDPSTWKDVKKLTNVKSASISRDSEAETLGSATIDVTESLGECYIRIYLITIQNGMREKHPLGTFLVQTPQSTFNGKIRDVSMDAYTPLLELKENPPPLGYSILKDENIMSRACAIVEEHARAPYVPAVNGKNLHSDFVSETSDTWLSFTSDLIANAKYHFELDENGVILFAPNQELDALQPVWTYDDGNSSILYPEISMNHDLFGVPNVVEVVYTKAAEHYYVRVVNDDPNSPTSTVNRGREILYRDANPNLNGIAGREQVEEYANRLLKDLSSVEYTVSYTHGYCPVRLYDCVRLNYTGAGITGVKAKVISQTIDCTPGCRVTEKAVFTAKLWEG